MSARVVLAVAAALAAAPAWADEKVAPMENVESSDSGPSERAQSFDSAPMEKVQSSDSAPMEKVQSFDNAPSEKVGSNDSFAPASGGALWARASSSGSHEYAKTSSGSHSSGGGRQTAGRSSGGHSEGSGAPRTEAQSRHPRPGTGTGRFDDGHRNNRYGSGYGGGYRDGYGYGWGSPFYGGYGRFGYYNPYDSWYSPYYYSGYYGYSPSYYRRGRGYGSYRDSGSLRIIVDPEKTRVYVDGYYAGIVDDFDGILQRLNVPPGRHDITLKLDGYRTQHFKVYVPVDDTIKIHYDMVRGAGEATSEEFAGRPDADYARVEDMDDDGGRRRGDRDGDRRDDDRRYEPRDRGYEGRDDGDTAGVRLQVSPRDASVYVDGEFRGSGRQSSNIRLRPGRHRIEVVRPGFRTVEREVDVQPGRSADLEFDLEKM